MELWIRSQDRKHLMKCEAIMYDETGTGYGLRAFTKNYDFNIARYKTKERALEILDEIEERIMLINTINIAKDTDSLIACKIALTEEKIKGLSYPYQMPEK